MLRKISPKLLNLTLAGALLFPWGTALAADKTIDNNAKEVVVTKSAKKTEAAEKQSDEKEISASAKNTDSKEEAAAKEADKQTGSPTEEKTEKRLEATNVPVKPVEKPPVRLVRPEVQRGDEISRLIADVDGDGKDELVTLMGNKIADSTHYMSDLYVVVKDLATNKVKGFVRPKNLGGYDAYLSVCDVTGDDASNIIVAAPTGGSGGIVDYRILDFCGPEPREIFGPNENKGVSVTGTFLPDFQVRLLMPSINKEFTLELPGDHEIYEQLNVYEPDGTVKNSGMRPYTQDLVNLIALDVNGDGRDEVIATQRVVGLTNSSPIGYVRSKWQYRAGSWQIGKVDFQTTLDVKQDYINDSVVKSKYGYEIKNEQVVVDDINLSYPHFSKLPRTQQWLINKQLENYAKTIMHEIVGKGSATVRYDVKYSGKKYVSILFTGSLNKNNKVNTIMEAFNIFLPTGEDLPLSKVVGSQGKFWKMIKDKSTKVNIPVTKKDVYGYYFDGDALVLLYNEGKEFELNATDVEHLLSKGEIGNEISTKQSNAVKTIKTEKTEDNKVKTK